MYKKTFQIIVSNLILPCTLIAMDREEKTQPSPPVTDIKTQKYEVPTLNPIFPEVGKNSSNSQLENEELESLRVGLEAAHISDKIATSNESPKQKEILRDEKKHGILPILSVVPDKVDLKNISELSNIIRFIIGNLQIPSQIKATQNPFESWALKSTEIGDDWLSNEFMTELILGYLEGIEPQLYNIMDPVDVTNNWWDLTSQILQSIQDQSDRNELSTFTIVPINFGNLHWATMIIEQNYDDPLIPTVFFFDSLDSSQQKLNTIETIVKDTQFFKNPHIIDLSSHDLTQDDGKTCGTWMLEAIKAIVQARKKGLKNDELREFVHQELTDVDMEAQHYDNLTKENEFFQNTEQLRKPANHTKSNPGNVGNRKDVKLTSKHKQSSSHTQVLQEVKLDSSDDVWFVKEGAILNPFDATKTLQLGHPNYEGNLNGIIRNILQSHNNPEHISLKQLHQMAYQELFQLPEYKEFDNTNYAFRYDTNTQRAYSINFLHLFVVTNEPKLLSLVLDKSFPDLTNIVDSQGNNILHVATYYGFHEMTDMIIKYAKRKECLDPLINGRNNDGTNPLGMLFLNAKVGSEFRFKTAELLIMEPTFEINRYLNNKRGMDVFAPPDLKSIGGFNCLHVTLKRKYNSILPLLSKRNLALRQDSEFAEVNFRYPAMNPEHHMWHPSKFANLLSTSDDGGVSRQMRSDYERLIKGIDESDESGDSDDDDTPAWHYKQSLLELSRFIDANQNGKIVKKHPITTSQSQINTAILNSPSKTPLNSQTKAQAEADITKVSVVHFHGVPFMQGQLTNYERREVGKKFIAINKEYMENKLQNSKKNEKLKAIYTRTATASVGIENHKMLIDASEERLDELKRINYLLRGLLADFYNSKKLLEQIRGETSYRYKQALKQKYDISSLNGEKKFDVLFTEARNLSFENIFLFVIQKYINDFTMLETMQFFWKVLEMGLGSIPKDVVQYRFPITSTGKSPDHPFKYGMGYNVEEDLRGEKPVLPNYKNGMPKHRLAGFLYVIMTDLATYADMENKGHVVDPIQYHKAQKLKLDTNIIHQSETSFLSGVDGENISLVIPLVYLNFKDKNKELYTRIFNLTAEDWRMGQRLNGYIQQRTSGGGTGAHTEQFKLLLKIYLPFAINLAETIAHLQHKAVHFIDSFGNLQFYSKRAINENGTYRTEVQDTIKNQVYAKSPEGKNKTPAKTKKFYHDVEASPKNVVQRLFVEKNEESPKKQEDEKKHLVTNVSLQKSAEPENKKLGLPLEGTDQIMNINSYKRDAENGDREALNKLESLAEKGSAHAQFNLARLYRKGTGVRQDDAEAVNWYIKAAEQEHVLAQYYLGFMYESGLGIQQSNAEAIKWYTKAAGHGDKPALQQLQKLDKK